jgi:protein-tyrosine-phosphatase
MRGWLVFKKDGILQVSSPTSQPWLDANLATIRYERAFRNGETPLYTFTWDVSDPLVKEHGPSPADYALAVAEAGAYHADLLLEVHERQQKGLASGEKEALADWGQVRKTIAFYEGGERGAEEAARVAVLTNDFDLSYEALNLMARHNIPFRVLHSSEVKAHDLENFDVVIAFATLSKEQSEGIVAFAEKGGVAVLVNLPGAYRWDSGAPVKTNGHSVTYAVGKGRVIELGEPVIDPETFAQDIRRLMVKERIPVSLWNSLTTLVAEYPGEKAGETIVELVNYDEEPTQVQVQVKGVFGSVRFGSPERGCCETLKASQVDGFTEFVVPEVVTGARVRLEAVGAMKAKETAK